MYDPSLRTHENKHMPTHLIKNGHANSTERAIFTYITPADEKGGYVVVINCSIAALSSQVKNMWA